MSTPIPTEALDDRLGFIGVSGSGKSYTATAAIERILDLGHRVVLVDPLDVSWGLRLMADSKTPSPYKIAIFGGNHGDLPLTEHAGALIGETVATMPESCIVSLGDLGTKASQRRFMLAFLESLYRHTDPRRADPYHLVFDEADLWAPQKSTEPQLQSRMEEIVRRGRVKGFIPWLITQRPAVLSKDVLSQVDGLIAMKLTASQDRDALGAWIEGQADKADGKRILASLPTLTQGHGVVWIPARGIMAEAVFPKKKTFDSSRTPKRGERRVITADLPPLDLTTLRERLASVKAETKANDPKALRAELAEVKRELERRGLETPGPDPRQLDALQKEAWADGYRTGWSDVRGMFLGILEPAMVAIPEDPPRFRQVKVEQSRAWVPTAKISPELAAAFERTGALHEVPQTEHPCHPRAQSIGTSAGWMLANIGVLRGKNLACWCPLDDSCHADILLELANKPDVVLDDLEDLQTQILVAARDRALGLRR